MLLILSKVNEIMSHLYIIYFTPKSPIFVPYDILI